MAYDTISATNLANWIPDVWAKDVLSFIERSLVLGQLVDRGYEDFVRSGGDKIVVPNLAQIATFTINTAVDATLYDAIQNVTNIAIDKKFGVAVMVDDFNKFQSNPKYFEKVRNGMAYSIAEQIDANIGGLIPSFDGTGGTVNVAITADTLIDAYEYLNENNAPDKDRAWVFDAASISDLLRTDYFIRMDYVPDSVVKNGFQGRQIFGSPVYISTNLPLFAGGPHAAAYFQREAIAAVIQLGPKFEISRIPLRFADAITGAVLFGVQEMRGTWGYSINTRS